MNSKWDFNLKHNGNCRNILFDLYCSPLFIFMLLHKHLFFFRNVANPFFVCTLLSFISLSLPSLPFIHSLFTCDRLTLPHFSSSLNLWEMIFLLFVMPQWIYATGLFRVLSYFWLKNKGSYGDEAAGRGWYGWIRGDHDVPYVRVSRPNVTLGATST